MGPKGWECIQRSRRARRTLNPDLSLNRINGATIGERPRPPTSVRYGATVRVTPVMADRGHRIFCARRGWLPPLRVLRRGLVARVAALGEAAQALDHRPERPLQAAPIDGIKRVLDQQSEFGVAVDGEAAREEQRVRILQAAREAIVIPGAGADRDFRRAAQRRRNPIDVRLMRPSRPASLTWIETIRPIRRCFVSLSSVGRNKRLSPAHSTADGGHCGRRLTRPARRAGRSGVGFSAFMPLSGIPCPARHTSSRCTAARRAGRRARRQGARRSARGSS